MNLDLIKRRWYYFAPVVLLLIPVLLVLLFSFKFGYGMSEAWRAVQHMGQSSTRYTQRFAERNFDKVRPGMTAKQVYDIMSIQPFERHGDTKWEYSLPQDGAQYFHERTLLLERDPKTNIPIVKQVIKRFHEPAAK